MYLRLSQLPRTNIGNAKLMLEWYGNELKYVTGVGWCWYNGKYWRHGRGDHDAFRAVRKTGDRIGDMADALEEDGQPKEAELWRKWGVRLGNTPRMLAAIRQLKGDVTIHSDEFDRDPMVVNFANGRMKLDEDVLKVTPHRREDMIWNIIDIEYDPDAKCERWKEFMEQRHMIRKWKTS